MKKILIIAASLICIIGLSVFAFFSKSESTQAENGENVFLKLQVMTEEIPDVDSKIILKQTAQILEKRLSGNGIQNVKIELYDSSEIGLTIPAEDYYLHEDTPHRIRRLIVSKGDLQFRETAENSIVWIILDKTPVPSLLVREEYNRACIGYAEEVDMAAIEMMFDNYGVRNELKDAGITLMWSAKPVKDSNTYELIAIKEVKENERILDGEDVKSARGTIDRYGNGNATVEITMTNEGAKAWADFTHRNIGRHVAIILDSLVYSYPIVASRIDGGLSSITGNITIEEAQDLAGVLESGALPVTVKIIEEK